MYLLLDLGLLHGSCLCFPHELRFWDDRHDMCQLGIRVLLQVVRYSYEFCFRAIWFIVSHFRILQSDEKGLEQGGKVLVLQETHDVPRNHDLESDW